MYAYKKEKPIVAFKFVALGDESGGDNFAELSADVEAAGGTCERSERAGGPVVVVKYDWKEVTLPLGHYVVFDGTGMGVVLTAQAFADSYAEAMVDGENIDLDALIADVAALKEGQGRLEQQVGVMAKSIDLLKAMKGRKGNAGEEAGEEAAETAPGS
jgi:hypothetical protein|nr:MAG TPA: hypothetical protein [Caudoviricetes sp.]